MLCFAQDSRLGAVQWRDSIDQQLDELLRLCLLVECCGRARIGRKRDVRKGGDGRSQFGHVALVVVTLRNGWWACEGVVCSVVIRRLGLSLEDVVRA